MRDLRVITAEPAAVRAALRDALTGEGPAILPLAVPELVEGAAAESGSRPSTGSGSGGVGSRLSTGERVPQRVAVVVQTSGSTGRPKRVALSADALLASAAASDMILGGPGQWLLCVPAHYIAGINVLVRSFAAQTEPVIMTGGFTASGFAEAAAALDHPVRYTSLVPTQLTRLLREDVGVEALRRFERVLVGGQALPERIHALAIESGVNITRTYGSSETSGGCVYDGLPIGDTVVRIHEGRVELSGSVLAEGYLDDPQRTAEAFIEDDGRRWFRTDDVGDLVDGVLQVTGRVDDVIVSGGVKVSLGEVEAVVRSLDGFADAVVVAAPHPEWGESPVVVSTHGMSLPHLREAVAARLGPAAAPARIVLVDALPLLASGKPDRVAIAAIVLR